MCTQLFCTELTLDTGRDHSGYRKCNSPRVSKFTKQRPGIRRIISPCAISVAAYKPLPDSIYVSALFSSCLPGLFLSSILFIKAPFSCSHVIRLSRVSVIGFLDAFFVFVSPFDEEAAPFGDDFRFLGISHDAAPQ
jgi:hypothetical protein